MRLSILFILTFSISFSQSNFEIIKNKSKVVIPFELINNLMFIQVKLNGEELTFLLDTGVEETVLFSLNEDNVLPLNEVETIKLKGLGNSEPIDGYKSSNNKFTIKQFQDLSHTLYIVMDQEINFSSHVGIPVNGILGYHFFKNHLVEINYSKKKIYVYAKGNNKKRKLLNKRFDKDSISIELNKPYVFKNITSKGKTKFSKLLIDTGNSVAVWVFNNEKVKIPLPDIYLEDFLGRGFNGDVNGKRARIEKIEFGNHEFKEPLTNFPDSISTQSVNFVDHRVGSIGGEILSRFTLFFDYPNNTIYTRPNKTIDDPFNFNMSGIEVEHAGLQWINEVINVQSTGIKVYTESNAQYGSKDNTKQNTKVQLKLIPIFNISNVRKNSEAEKAGLKKGDRIISINNKNAERFTIQKIHEILKSEEGKTIQMIINRNNVKMKIKFQLKKII
jgi:hypothetical protein